MQRPNQREKLIFLMTLVIFTFGFFKACWIPSRMAIDEIDRQIQYMQEQVVTMSQDSTVVQIANLPPDLTRVEMSLVGSLEDVRSVAENLTSPLLLKGLRVVESRFSEIEKDGSLVRQPVILRLEGGFQKAGSYLHAVEMLNPPLIVDSISLEAVPEKVDQVKVFIQGSVYGRENAQK
jgi:hypothetical protein